MQLSKPKRFQLILKGREEFEIKTQNECKFTNPYTTTCPKIYIFSEGTKILYVGQTIQSIRNRLRQGFKATGSSGYWGYQFRDKRGNNILCLDVWIIDEISEDQKEQKLVLESLEAEIVFLYRKNTDSWPEYQNEIHFHHISENVKQNHIIDCATSIVDHIMRSNASTNNSHN